MPNQWSANKDAIVRAVTNGTATPSHLAWYNKWLSLGSPSTQQAMEAAQQPTAGGMLTPQENFTFGGTAPTAPTAPTTPASPASTASPESQYQSYVDAGVLNPDGSMNEAWATDPANRDALYEYATGGFGLGSSDYQRSLIEQAKYYFQPTTMPATGGPNDLTFGGPTEAYTKPDAAPAVAQQPTTPDWQSGVEQYNMTMRGEATPFLDSYMRAREQQQRQGPVSGLFAKELGGN